MNHSFASISGRKHRLFGQNCQDFAFCHSPASQLHYGVVLDGCGSPYRDETGRYPSKNECGAQLLGTFITTWLNIHLENETEPNQLVDQLGDAIERYLSNQLNAIPFQSARARQRHLYTHWLATILGYVVTPLNAYFFSAGDGFLIINDRTILVDANNQPRYFAYRLIGQAIQFQTRSVELSLPLTQIGVATDGWCEQDLSSIGSVKNSTMLQRYVNRTARLMNKFDDDGAIALSQVQPLEHITNFNRSG